MKLVSFSAAGRASWGVLEHSAVRDLGALLGADYPDLMAAITAGALDQAVAGASKAPSVALADLTWLPVIRNPGKILCVGHNYETHRQETGRAKVGHPSIFPRFADTLTSHLGTILLPRVSSKLDYEGELAVVIGRGGRYISEADAMDHVAGFSCANDASVRDWQWHTQQFTPGKNFPGTCALGPHLVTPDEIEDLDAVTVTTRLNGEVMQHASLADLIFPIPTIIAYVSSFTPLSPGDIILTGTPGGVGAKREPPVWMKAGDRVEIDIAGVGSLVNRIADEG